MADLRCPCPRCRFRPARTSECIADTPAAELVALVTAFWEAVKAKNPYSRDLVWSIGYSGCLASEELARRLESGHATYWLERSREVTAQLAESERRESALRLRAETAERVSADVRREIVLFGRQIAERFAREVGDFPDQREHFSRSVRHAIGEHLGIEMAPAYECPSCDGEYSEDAGPEEAAIVAAGRCPFEWCGNAPLKVRL